MITEQRKYAIIVAGGVGKRMVSSIPKQFIEIAGTPLLMHTINRFKDYDKNIFIIIALPESLTGEWMALCEKHNFTRDHKIIEGGNERFYSVKNGLREISGDALIAIHDGVRPFVSVGTISRCFEIAGSRGNAVPVISPLESVRQIINIDESRPLNREGIKLVQTPQVFRSDILHKAYDCGYSPDYTDDATVVERLGIQINMVEGNRENIKITTPGDLVIAEALFKNEEHYQTGKRVK